MGTREIIFLLFVYIHLVTSQGSAGEAAAPPPPCSLSPPQPPYSSLNSCPNHLISQIINAALACTPPSVAPPPPSPDNGGDLSPVTGKKLSTATFADVIVRAFSASTKEEGKQWDILFILLFPVAVRAIFLCEIPLRNLSPQFALERLLVILFVNATTAFLLPPEWKWVPAVCFISSLLILIVAPLLLP